MANGQGEKATAADFNALFTQLENIRKNQAARADLSGQTELQTAFPTNVAARGNKIVSTASATSSNKSVFDQIKANITTLANNGTGVASTFASNVIVPSVSQLLAASQVATAATQITSVEGVCANCAHYTTATNQGHFTAHYTNASSQGHFSSNFSHNSSNFTNSTAQGHQSHFATKAGQGNFTTR